MPSRFLVALLVVLAASACSSTTGNSAVGTASDAKTKASQACGLALDSKEAQTPDNLPQFQADAAKAANLAASAANEDNQWSDLATALSDNNEFLRALGAAVADGTAKDPRVQAALTSKGTDVQARLHAGCRRAEVP